MNQLSSIARSPEFKRFYNIVKSSKLCSKWNEPDTVANARISGCVLNNQNPSIKTIDDKPNEEYLITLDTAAGSCTINLCHLLSLAYGYIDNQYAAVNKLKMLKRK